MTLAAGQLVAYCTHAEGPPQKIAEGLVQYRDRGPTGSFGRATTARGGFSESLRLSALSIELEARRIKPVTLDESSTRLSQAV